MSPQKSFPLNKPLRETIYADLKRQILSGRLLPGSRLIESTLADQLQVSRTVIREVIKQLEMEGLVKIIPYKGTEVTRFSLEDIAEIYDIQAALEGMAAGLAVKRMSKEEIRDLRIIQQRLHKALQKNPEEWQKINVIFHQFFIGRCGNQRLQSLIKNQRDYFARYWRIILSIPGQREKNTEDHEKILMAVENDDSLKVRLAMEEHILHAAQNLRQFLADNVFLI
ncbi:MAG: GntR family transcriptional regulator [Deltaproteobacteria bacterium]|nr:GntR family transcriptional regulator [Deltaproteobacteria bacterium]